MLVFSAFDFFLDRILSLGNETYAGVDWLVAYHVTVFMDAMIGLAEGDAWEEIGHAAETDRAEASEERGVPWTSVGGS